MHQFDFLRAKIPQGFPQHDRISRFYELGFTILLSHYCYTGQIELNKKIGGMGRQQDLSLFGCFFKETGKYG